MQGGTLQEESEIDQEHRGEVVESGTTARHFSEDPAQQVQINLARTPTFDNQKGEEGLRDTLSQAFLIDSFEYFNKQNQVILLIYLA